MLDPANLLTMVKLLANSVVLHQQASNEEALALLDDALALDRRFLPAHFNRAQLLLELGHHQQAVESLDAYLSLLPDDVAARELRGKAVAAGLAACDAAIASNASGVQPLLQRAEFNLLVGRYAEAARDYQAVLVSDPGNATALNNLGNAHVSLGDEDAALVAYEEALAGHPDDALALHNRGNLLRRRNRLDEALASHRAALAIRPDFPEVQVEIALAQLTMGNFAAGWTGFEARWRTDQLAQLWRGVSPPAWDGKQPLAGRTILLWHEQGLGDTLQFVRFVPALAARGARIVLLAPPVLRPLLATLDAPIELVDNEAGVPTHDFHCPLMSLPHVLGIAAPPAQPPYLHADPQRVAHWRERLGERHRPRIGLVWHGRSWGPANPTRNLDPALLSVLFDLDCDFYSLQTGPAGEHPPAGVTVLTPQLTDFAESAAALAHLDLLISVDTAAAHLAGALGTPCWLLLRHWGEWRWQLARADSPWYPSLRIFRQAPEGGWPTLLAEVHTALAQFLAKQVRRQR